MLSTLLPPAAAAGAKRRSLPPEETPQGAPVTTASPSTVAIPAGQTQNVTTLPLSAAGQRLKQFYLSMNIESHWIPERHVSWETASPTCSGRSMLTAPQVYYKIHIHLPSNTPEEASRPNRDVKEWRDSAAARAFTHRALMESRHHQIHQGSHPTSQSPRLSDSGVDMQETKHMNTKYCSIEVASIADLGALVMKRNSALLLRRFAVALCALVVFAPLPSRVEAQCGNWNVSGDWGLKQSDGIVVRIHLAQIDNDIVGDASYSDNHHAGLQKGGIRGTLEGNKLKLRVSWTTGNVGDWTGTIQPSGVIQGRASDENAPSYRATFVSDRAMKCPQPQPVPPPQVQTSQLPTPPPLTNNIRRGSFVILQSLPANVPDPSHDLAIGQKYKVIGRSLDTLTIRGPSGRPYHVSVSAVQLVQ